MSMNFRHTKNKNLTSLFFLVLVYGIIFEKIYIFLKHILLASKIGQQRMKTRHVAS